MKQLNLRFKHAAMVLLLLLLTLHLKASELSDRLLSIKGIIAVEQIEKGFFNERYVVTIEQLLDHKNASRGKFEQRFVVSHVGFDRPTLLVTEGYGGARALKPRYREEISTRLNTNQIFVEHRFFGESTPKPRNWNYMTGENAAADLHSIREALATIYSHKWIATGVSKGGQNAMIYRTFYPQDVDVTVAYVGPVCFGVEDGRHEPFLEKVGTDEERAVIRDFQLEVLKRKTLLMPMFEEHCQSKGYKFTIPTSEVFDFCVLEYPFALWQWGTATSLIPSLDSPHEEMFEHLIAVASPDYFAISDEPSFFVQAARELGYYGYDTKPFEGMMTIKTAKNYLSKIFLPADAKKIKFSDVLSKKITSYLKNNDPRLICIYGEIDPWSAAAVDQTLFEGKQNMKLIVESRGSHKARINTLPEELREQTWRQIEEWIFKN